MKNRPAAAGHNRLINSRFSIADQLDLISLMTSCLLCRCCLYIYKEEEYREAQSISISLFHIKDRDELSPVFGRLIKRSVILLFIAA